MQKIKDSYKYRKSRIFHSRDATLFPYIPSLFYKMCFSLAPTFA
ncbi:hypothetical protein bcere0024_054910 [Bacillus cereus Rock4-18]|nr:hypothetical protein bcere0024_054910 [Bacillus cereus Rock4-18]